MLFSFDDFTLDCERRELHARGAIIPVEPQVFDLLVYLIENRDRVVSKDDLIASVWSGRIVSDSTLDSRINAVRKALGDSGGQQAVRAHDSHARAVRFVANVRDRRNRPLTAGRHLPRKQEISFLPLSRQRRIAYAAVGSGPVLVKAANWLTHLEYDWESPVWSPLLQRFAEPKTVSFATTAEATVCRTVT